jgi:CheY-like chemotaxis protein/anti-sigma regulatory factor (Ser/Thr protein kinase)
MVSDPSMLEHVINELISNAIKYTDAGGVMITSRIAQLEQDARIIIEVADTGIGIPPDHQGAVFDAFRQVSEGWDRIYEGTGLGLTICKQYVRLLGGEIMIDSELGKGSKFTLSFSTELEQKTTDTVTEPAVTLANSPTRIVPDSVILPLEQTPKSDPELPRILLVDDDEMCHILVAGALREIVTLDYSTNAAEALLLAKEHNYPLILLDINLKRGLSGIDVLNDLKLTKNYYKVPIIAVTAFAMLGDREKFLSMGFSDFISKPFTAANLVTIVNKWLKP